MPHCVVSQRELDLDQVLNQTLQTVQRAREEMFAIAEDARRELDETRAELERVRTEVEHQIQLVDQLQQEDRKARARLLEVSRDFTRYHEEDIRNTYEQAKEVQTKLQVAIERERGLRQLRDSLERRLRAIQRTIERAEGLISQVGLALRVLRGNLDRVAPQVESVRLRQALGVSIIKAQEEERRRLARDIHDGPAQLLANVAFRIDICERLLARDLERVRQELAQLKSLVAQSVQDVRKIIFDLRPLAIDDLGLAPAVRGLTAELATRVGLKTRLHVAGRERRLHQVIEIAAFRIVQEALNNVWKHAGTLDADLWLFFGEDQLDIQVRDHGCGFDVDAALARAAGGHFGLVNIQERVTLLQGSCELISRPGRGTTLRVSLPLDLQPPETLPVEPGLEGRTDP